MAPLFLLMLVTMAMALEDTTPDYTVTYNPGQDCLPYDGSVVPDCAKFVDPCLLYTSPSPRDGLLSRMPSSA